MCAGKGNRCNFYMSEKLAILLGKKNDRMLNTRQELTCICREILNVRF